MKMSTLTDGQATRTIVRLIRECIRFDAQLPGLAPTLW